MREASKHERSMLVKSSLHSLLQLRDHLTSQLSGLKVADKPANASGDPADERGAQQHRFVRNPTNRTRWGIVSEGADFGEMVVRVEVNPPPPLAKATPIHPEPTWKGECI
jgi:hypothetical protein